MRSYALPTTRLTPREEEVLDLIGEGLTNKEVADRLVVSIKTVEAHKQHLREKLDLNSGNALMAHAIRRQIKKEATF